jgi:alkanesulfonate monooxygenase SsuD/methylene tetrahydromethanopterin reductase-like flavin-dependent oxidoreductase (luciferase family)
MSNTHVTADSSQMSFAEFFDAIAARAPIYGEHPDSHRQFRHAIMSSLKPFTPYERAVAENLVAIDWEILQKRRMMDALTRQAIEQLLAEVALKYAKEQHERDLDAAWDAFEDSGGTEHDWDPEPFDKERATRNARELSNKALSLNPDTAAAAFRTLHDMGVDAVLVMGEAHLKMGPNVKRMDEDIRHLERRRREVKKDYDTLRTFGTYQPRKIQ